MGNEQTKAAIAKLKAAREALHANSDRETAAGIREGTPEYQRLNKAVIDAEKDVAWWRR